MVTKTPPIEEILPHLFKVEIPLPNSPLKAVNSYMIKSTERNLVIDTGMSRTACLESIRTAIKKLDIDLDRTDFFITHDHIDHIGLAGKLAAKSAKFYLNKIEADFHNHDSWTQWADRISTFAEQYGFFREGVEKIKGIIADEQQRIIADLKYTALKENDVLNAGEYSFRCIETPGHSRGHICLYDSGHRLMISGDHILGDITPNISSRFDDTNPLLDYMNSLDKVYPLDVGLCLPGHRSPIIKYKTRIDELKKHHLERADEILGILESGNKSAYQVASQMRWDIVYDTFEEFPVYPKWFAFGEALSHLHYLESLGKVYRTFRPDKKITYGKYL